jgi:predicted secreted protein
MLSLSNLRYGRLLPRMRPCALAFCLVVAGVQTVAAQPVGAAASANLVHLSASATREVAQDYLRITLSATREGADATTLHNQLKSALDSALAQAKAVAAEGQLEVRTGNYSLQPRYEERNSKISGWRGRAELVLEGRDFMQLSALAGRIQTMVVEELGFSLSRQGREAVEQQVQSEAIARFKTKAAQVAQDFGFARYSLRDVVLNSEDAQRPMQAMRMSSKAMAADAPLPVEAGKAAVTVSVSGNIQLQ